MSNTTVIIFVAIEEQEFKKLDLVLPVTNWTIDLGNLLQKTYENRSESKLCMVSGRGASLNNILNIQQHHNLTSLNFMNRECSTLQGLELASAIKSLTKVIDELMNKNLDSSLSKSEKQANMEQLFEKATVNYNLEWNNGDDCKLFSFIKTLLYVMDDALANNKVFLFVNYQY